MSTGIHNRVFFASISFNLVTKFKDILQECVTKKNDSDTIFNPSSSIQYTEIQKYVGWAIFPRKKVAQNKLRGFKAKREMQSGENKTLKDNIALLESKNVTCVYAPCLLYSPCVHQEGDI